MTLQNRPCSALVAAEFDQPAGASQIRWDQSSPADYSYNAFSQNVKTSGCAGYIVSMLGKRVLHFGRIAETHVEHFPQ